MHTHAHTSTKNARAQSFSKTINYHNVALMHPGSGATATRPQTNGAPSTNFTRSSLTGIRTLPLLRCNKNSACCQNFRSCQQSEISIISTVFFMQAFSQREMRGGGESREEREGRREGREERGHSAPLTSTLHAVLYAMEERNQRLFVIKSQPG